MSFAEQMMNREWICEWCGRRIAGGVYHDCKQGKDTPRPAPAEGELVVPCGRCARDVKVSNTNDWGHCARCAGEDGYDPDEWDLAKQDALDAATPAPDAPEATGPCPKCGEPLDRLACGHIICADIRCMHGVERARYDLVCGECGTSIFAPEASDAPALNKSEALNEPGSVERIAAILPAAEADDGDTADRYRVTWRQRARMVLLLPLQLVINLLVALSSTTLETLRSARDYWNGDYPNAV